MQHQKTYFLLPCVSRKLWWIGIWRVGFLKRIDPHFRGFPQMLLRFWALSYIRSNYEKLLIRIQNKRNHNSRFFPVITMPQMEFFNGPFVPLEHYLKGSFISAERTSRTCTNWSICGSNRSSHGCHSPKAKKFLQTCWYSGKFRLSPASAHNTYLQYSGFRHLSPFHKVPR